MNDKLKPQKLISIEKALAKHNRDLLGIARMALGKAREIGELISAAKSLMPHGQFEGWCEHNTPWSSRRCQQYVQIAKSDQLRAFDPETSVVSFLRTISKPKNGERESTNRTRAPDTLRTTTKTRWEDVERVLAVLDGLPVPEDFAEMSHYIGGVLDLTNLQKIVLSAHVLMGSGDKSDTLSLREIAHTIGMSWKSVWREYNAAVEKCRAAPPRRLNEPPQPAELERA